MADSQLLGLLDSGTRRLVRSVDALADERWAQPSLLPGWSRAHVVAHLALGAEALSAAIDAAYEGRTPTMYASDAAREAAIGGLAASRRSELRSRFLASTTLIRERIDELADNLDEAPIERTPGGQVFAAGDVGIRRLREVEIHHADLGLGYTAADWPAAYVVLMIGSLTPQHQGPGFVASATDLGRSWTFGAGGPTVSGPGSALAWWLTGRGTGEGLTTDDGRVPRTEPW